MRELKVLIVENDPHDVQIYTDTIKTINRENDNQFRIVPTICHNKEEGLLAIKSEDWVAAFIDLKLSTGDILNAAEGNEIVNEIYQKLRFPVFILTNTPRDVDDRFKQSFLLRISPKNDIDYYEVFNQIIAIFKTGISEILGGKGIIENYISKIFWQHLNNTLQFWIKQKIDEEELRKIILRFTLSHLQENLFRNEIGDFEKHHPCEFYIYPSINEELFTGNIIRFDGKLYIILTPACDLVIRNYKNYKAGGEPAQRNTDSVLLVRLKEINTVEGLENIANNERGKEKLLNKAKKNQYYFLPPFMDVKGFLIDFRDCRTLLLDDIQNKYSTVATISSSYLKDVIANFSYYYSRQGAPDLKQEYYFEDLYNNYYNGKTP